MLPSLPVIRPAMVSDWVGIEACYQALLTEDHTPYPTMTPRDIHEWVQNLAYDLLNHQDQRCVFVAMDQTRLVASIDSELGRRPFGSPANTLIGGWLYIHPAFRRGGLGHQMVQTVCTWGRTRGAESFEWDVTVGRDSYYQHAWWQSRGASPYLIRYHAPIDRLVAEV